MNFVEKKSAKTFPGRQNPDPHYLAALERGRILQEQLKRWRGGGITVADSPRRGAGFGAFGNDSWQQGGDDFPRILPLFHG